MSNWSCGLPRDLLSSILQRLTTLRDWIRFSAVCVGWRSSVAEIGYPSQHPWLLLPRSQADKDNQTWNFYSLSDRKEYTIRLPGVRWNKCIGASEGWLILYGRKGEMRLLNPLTRSQIRLPSIPATLCRTDPGFRIEYMRAVVSWSSASSYTVVFLRNTYSTIAFVRAGDSAWTVVKRARRYSIYDLIHHKGLFYIRISDYISDYTESLDLAGPSPKFTEVEWDWRSEVGDRSMTSFQMVESSGDLFHIVRSMIVVSGLEKTVRAKVYKLDPNGHSWTEVQTLGNRTLFLSDNHSMSIPAHNFPGMKENCIYFADEYFHPSSDMIPDMNVFDLEDASVKIYNPHDSHLTCPLPAWFVPNLSRRDI